MLAKIGFKIEFATGIFQFLPPIILAMRAMPYRLGLAATPKPQDVADEMRRQHEINSRFISRTFDWLQRHEVERIRAGRESGFGAVGW